MTAPLLRLVLERLSLRVHGDGGVLLLDDGMLDVEIRQLVVESRQVVERLFFVQLSKIS